MTRFRLVPESLLCFRVYYVVGLSGLCMLTRVKNAHFLGHSNVIFLSLQNKYMPMHTPDAPSCMSLNDQYFQIILTTKRQFLELYKHMHPHNMTPSFLNGQHFRPILTTKRQFPELYVKPHGKGKKATHMPKKHHKNQ